MQWAAFAADNLHNENTFTRVEVFFNLLSHSEVVWVDNEVNRLCAKSDFKVAKLCECVIEVDQVAPL